MLLLEALLPRVFAVPQRVLIVPLHPALAQTATALVQRAPELCSSVQVVPFQEASHGALLSTLRAIASAAQAGAALSAVHVLGGLPDLKATGSPSDLLPLVPSSNAEQQQRYTEALSALASLATCTRVALDASFNLPTGGCPGAGAAPGLVARSVFIVVQGTDLHSAAQALIDDLLIANAQVLQYTNILNSFLMKPHLLTFYSFISVFMYCMFQCSLPLRLTRCSYSSRCTLSSERF